MANYDDTIKAQSISEQHLTQSLRNKLNSTRDLNQYINNTTISIDYYEITANSTIARGDYISLRTDGKCEKTSGNDCIGIATNAGGANSKIKVQYRGVFNFGDNRFSGNINKSIFLKNGIQNLTYPSLTTNDKIQKIGTSFSANEIIINLEPNYTQL